MRISGACGWGKNLPRAHEAWSFTLITGEERVRKIIWLPLTSFLSARMKGERITAFLWFTRLVHLSQKEENAILKLVAWVRKLRTFIPRQCSGGLCVSVLMAVQWNPKRGEAWVITTGVRAVLWTHCTHGNSFLGEVIHHSLGKSRMKYGCRLPKRDNCDLLHGHSADCCRLENDLLLLGMSHVVQTSVTCLLTVSSEILRLDCYI